METSPAVVTPVLHGAHRPAARLLAAAFLDEPVSLAVYPHASPARRLHNLVADFTVELEVCTRRGTPLQVVASGTLAAAAVIYPPGAYPLPRIEETRIFLGSILGHYPYDLRTWMRWLERAEAHHPHTPHFYLEYLGVLPAVQGRGMGSALLRCLAARADEAGMPCYLETATPRNLPLYARFGFQTIAEEEIIGLPAWFMLRPPHPR